MQASRCVEETDNDLEIFLKSQGCEVYVPGIVNFVLFKIDNRLDDIKLYGGNTIKYQINKILLDYLLSLQTVMIKAFKEHPEEMCIRDSITADHREMLENSERVIDGMFAVAKYLDIKRIIIGIESNKPDAIKLMKEKLASDPRNKNGMAGVLTLRAIYRCV